MGNEQMLAADVLTNEDVSESVHRRLEMIEMALHDGDLVAAQHHLRSTRLWLVDAAGDSTSPSMVGGVALTGQEMASLRLLPDGSMSQKDMARAMGVTRNTLKTHLKSLYLKLGAHCRAEAIDAWCRTLDPFRRLGKPLLARLEELFPCDFRVLMH